jgi:Flp pilus assembly protein TadG
MIGTGKIIRRDEQGTAAVEMAIGLPILVTMIYGIFTLGQLFAANAGMQHALGEGARYGNLCLSVTNGTCTLPTSTAIGTKVSQRLFSAKGGTFDTPSVTKTTANSGYVTVTVGYHQTLNFIFFTGPTVNLSQSKRVYLADTPPSSAACTAATTPPASCSIYS